MKMFDVRQTLFNFFSLRGLLVVAVCYLGHPNLGHPKN